MTSEHRLRRARRRRWTVFVTAYWVAVSALLVLGVDRFAVWEAPGESKFTAGLLGAMVLALLVHWGVVQTVALRR